MDDLVKAALRKWPNVPHCHGWLALDGRGDWYMRDDRTQAAGPFPQVRGSRIEHDKLRAFIERNYLPDTQGAWFFQNGPQRVYVDLEVTPLVWRLQRTPAGGADVVSHHGLRAEAVSGVWLDEQGRLYLDTPQGFGLVHGQDMDAAADQVLAGRWTPQTMVSALMPARFGFVLRPRPAPGS